MNTITREIVESHLKCKYKSHLRLKGVKGTKSDYEERFTRSMDHFKQQAMKKILAGCIGHDVLCDTPLTRKVLAQGAPYILNGIAGNGSLSLLFDGLVKVDGSCKAGAFHYIPILFCMSDRISVQERRLLAVFGLVLSRIQGCQPHDGLVVYGQQAKTIRIKLYPDDRKTRRVLDEITDMQREGCSPPLMLNDHCHICEFEQHCRQQAADEDNLSQLRGMTEKQINAYGRRGIFTVTQLSYTYHARRKTSQGKAPHHDFALQALAIREKRVFVREVPNPVSEPVRIFLDIEGLPERPFDYLVGALICTPSSVTYRSFWADDPSREIEILEDFLELLRSFDRFHVFHYGAYEVGFMKRMRAKVSSQEAIDKLLLNATNVLSLIYGRIYFPVYSNSLKHIAQLLGFHWTDSLASGINSIAWRREWEDHQDPETKERLLTYNREDCTALKVVTDFISDAVGAENTKETDSPCGKRLQVCPVSNISPTYSRPNWRTPQFAIDDLNYVNRCSYFNYQREKIYVRSNENIARQHRRRTRPAKRVEATTKPVELESASCPHCGSEKLTKCSKYVRRRQCLDLRITGRCVRRVVNELASPKYRCGECGKEFFHEQYMKLPKYGHSLKSWAMYEYVAHRASLASLEGTLRDLFGLRVPYGHIYLIKHIMADYYRETIEGIRRRLVSGPIMHADETQVHHRQGKGYVWVFANLEEVLYVFKPSRDGGFLKEMFSDFSGVLISDFYAVYDWPHCAHQKCLIHLIRDLNNDLLRNPYDEEFKDLVADFGTLLRNIIVTVDKYGLKRRHLAKHQPEADRFLKKVGGRSYRSGVAQAAQERIIRYRDDLFTFLKYDGVPWNNNNAEHAIKRFAHYRETTDGHVSESGLADYLVLLSIYQTCEYKGINFLKFLLSGETDMEHYCEPKRKMPRPVNVDASPMDLVFFNRTLKEVRSLMSG